MYKTVCHWKATFGVRFPLACEIGNTFFVNRLNNLQYLPAIWTTATQQQPDHPPR